MKKLCLLLLAITLFFVNSSAQDPSESLRSAFQDGEYFFAREDFMDALMEYTTVYKRGYSENANLNYRIGICYLNIPGEKDKAIPYLEQAIHNVSVNHIEGQLREKTAPLDAFLFLGDAYRVNNKLDKAILSYTEFIEIYENKEDLNAAYARNQIRACKLAKELMTKPVVLERENMGKHINSSSSNFAAVISGDGSTLAYMNELPFYTAVFMCKKQDDGTWSEPENLTPQIQSDGNQYVASLSYNADKLFLVEEGLFDSEIKVSERLEDGTYSPSVSLNKNVNTKYWESHASISSDGKILYFTSNRKESLGEMDIFYSEWNEEGYWGEAKNIGGAVNTVFNEDFPFISKDGSRLYFSSQGHNSMGGFDIFYATKNDSGIFANPVNIGYPINTTDDDHFFFPIEGGNYGLKALISEDGYGKEDIYKLRIVSVEEAAKLIAEKVESDTQEEVNVQEEKEEIAETPVEEVVEEEAAEEPESVEKPEPVKEVVPAVDFKINNLYFAFDSEALSVESKKELDRYKELLPLLADASFKLYGYTDSQGPEDYNDRLSEKRAYSARDYLIGLGFTKEQIYTVGRGESDPIADNSVIDTRKRNRRVEIKISGYNKEQLNLIK